MKGYKTDSKVSYTSKRVGTELYRKMHELRDNWEVVPKKDYNLCGNVNVEFRKDGDAFLSTDSLYLEDKSLTASYEQISSALALYRIISMFQCGLNAEDCDFYSSIGVLH